MITEKKQANSNIELRHIYDAIRYLKPEQQGIILNNYKVTELYAILADDNEYEKCLRNLFDNSNAYSMLAIALMALHTEAVMEKRGRSKVDVMDSINKAYNSMSEEDKKIFCGNMLQKKAFFVDAYKMMMDSFESAVEVDKSDKGECEEMGK